MSSVSVAIRPYFVHPTALVASEDIGPRTRIWAFTNVLATARIGADCQICDHALIEDRTIIGDRVTIKSYVGLAEGTTLEDDVFVGPYAGFTNDRYPRSRDWSEKYPNILVKRGASIGSHAIILPGLTIGEQAMIGAGAVLTRDVPARAIMVGNPAYVKGYVGAVSKRPVETRTETHSSWTPLAGGASLLELPQIQDARGVLNFAEIDGLLPFRVLRYFLVHGVPSRELRGEHAHKTLHQFLVCVSGSCSVRLFDGRDSDEIRLDRPALGLHVPPMVWTTQYKFSSDAVLLVLASDIYRESDYIRDADAYRSMLSQVAGPVRT